MYILDPELKQILEQAIVEDMLTEEQIDEIIMLLEGMLRFGEVADDDQF